MYDKSFKKGDALADKWGSASSWRNGTYIREQEDSDKEYAEEGDASSEPPNSSGEPAQAPPGSGAASDPDVTGEVKPTPP